MATNESDLQDSVNKTEPLHPPTSNLEILSNAGQEAIQARKSKTALKFNTRRSPVHITWKNITYSVQIRDPTSKNKCYKPHANKVILKNINGHAKPGELVAIMGPSGSGKTTLLNVLANRIIKTKGSKLTGKIALNGIDRNTLGSKFAKMSAFVQQDDVLFNMQTVKETLMTAARFRLSKKLSYNQKEERVNAIIQELGLTKAMNTIIGDERIRGVSGGERKRCNVGVELIQDPSIIFLDEPTSGLDSFQALNVIETLKLLCESGCTVICSIHQPRSSIFALIDHLIILADGNLVYDGLGREAAVKYFASLNYECPALFNPSDYFLDIVSLDNKSKEDEERSQKRIQFLIESFNEKQKNKTLPNETIDDEILQSSSQNLAIDDSFLLNQNESASILDQIIVLTKRSTRQMLRDRVTISIRLFMTFFFAAFLSAVYSGNNLSQKSIQNRVGILMFIAINQSFGPMMGTINTFTIEKGIVMRERQGKAYNLSIYYITKFLTSLPFEMVYPLIYGSFLYWICNLNPDPVRFLIFLLITIMTSLAAAAMGFLVGSFSPSADAANAIAPLFMVLAVLFAGFYVNSTSIPIWLRWIQNLSTIHWAFVSFVINEFSGLKFNCDSDSTQSCIQYGSEEIHLLSFSHDTTWSSFRNLVILFFAFHILSYILLRITKTKYQTLVENNNPKLNDAHTIPTSNVTVNVHDTKINVDENANVANEKNHQSTSTNDQT